MNHVVAYELLVSELAEYRGLPFRDLAGLIGERSSRIIRGKDGVDYDLSVVVRWRLHPDGDICVLGFIGEANWGGPHDGLDETMIIPHPNSRRT